MPLNKTFFITLVVFLNVPDGLKRRPASRLNVSRMWCLEQQRLSLLGKALLHHMQAAAVAPSSDYDI